MMQQPKQKGKSLISLKSLFHKSAGYKAIFFLSGVAYWLLYAFSTGVLFYYPSKIVSIYLKTSQIPNPLIGFDFSSFSNFYYSGMVWYPNGHIEIVLLVGNTLFSIVLSTLFALNILVASYGLRLSGSNARRSGLGGLAGLILSLFTSGCCAVPVGTLLFGSIIPSTILTTIEFENPFLLNLGIATVMYISLVYASRKIRHNKESSSSCSSAPEELK